MSLSRLLKWVGIVALIAGIIGYLLPGQFIYSPGLDSLLTHYGDALFPGISSNPMVKLIIPKAPVIGLALVGCILVLWGTFRAFQESEELGLRKPDHRDISSKNQIDHQRVVRNNREIPKKSIKELSDRKKP